MSAFLQKKHLFTAVVIACLCTSAFALERSDFYGSWELMYGGGYGYEFRFKENYIAYVILYQKDSMWVFKGVYTVEHNELRINISDMKNEKSRSNIENSSNFLKARSQFYFKAKKRSKNAIELSPTKVTVDDNDSPGYFESKIVLKAAK